jgi:hypothetical protein
LFGFRIFGRVGRASPLSSVALRRASGEELGDVPALVGLVGSCGTIEDAVARYAGVTGLKRSPRQYCVVN